MPNITGIGQLLLNLSLVIGWYPFLRHSVQRFSSITFGAPFFRFRFNSIVATVKRRNSNENGASVSHCWWQLQKKFVKIGQIGLYLTCLLYAPYLGKLWDPKSHEFSLKLQISVMLSIAVSKIGMTELIFVVLGMKVNCQYYSKKRRTSLVLISGLQTAYTWV